MKKRKVHWTPKKIKGLRARFNLSQAAFAKKIDKFQQLVSRWETGKERPTRGSEFILTSVESELEAENVNI